MGVTKINKFIIVFAAIFVMAVSLTGCGGEEAEPSMAEGLSDGVYEGVSEEDDRGQYGEAIVTVEDGQIVDVEYIEHTEEGPKDEDYDYEPTIEAMEELPQRLIDAQFVEDVDTYTEATSTTEKFKEAVENALQD